jgi:hypothetical protein
MPQREVATARLSGSLISMQSAMQKEKSALLNEAARCRRTADETILPAVAEKLRAMAAEYEARAAKLAEQHSARSQKVRVRRMLLAGRFGVRRIRLRKHRSWQRSSSG